MLLFIASSYSKNYDKIKHVPFQAVLFEHLANVLLDKGKLAITQYYCIFI